MFKTRIPSFLQVVKSLLATATTSQLLPWEQKVIVGDDIVTIEQRLYSVSKEIECSKCVVESLLATN